MIKADWTPNEKLASVDLNQNFVHLKCNVAGSELHVTSEVPAYLGTPGKFQTAYIYVPGSLRVYMGRTRQLRYLTGAEYYDYKEYSDIPDVNAKLLQFLAGPGASAITANPILALDATGDLQIRVDYVRGDL